MIWGMLHIARSRKLAFLVSNDGIKSLVTSRVPILANRRIIRHFLGALRLTNYLAKAIKLPKGKTHTLVRC